VVKALECSERADELFARLRELAATQPSAMHPDLALRQLLMALELMINESWVRATLAPSEPCIVMRTPKEGGCIHTNFDLADPGREAATAETAAP
jgi:hypothetical protein